MFSEQLYEICEEFFDLISAEDRTEKIEAIIDEVNEYLINEIDAQPSTMENYVIAEEVENRIEELWALLPSREGETDHNLFDYYEEIIAMTSRVIDRAEGAIEDEEGDFDYEDYCDEEEYEC